MFDVKYEDIEKNKMDMFIVLVNSMFDDDYNTFLKYHPPASQAQFSDAVSTLQPLGKPVKVEYLCHLVKHERIKVLCKVTYSQTPEELVWDFNLIPDDDDFRLVNLGFDK